MSVEFVLNAAPRGHVGKGASRRLRLAEDLVPAILYGADVPPQPISLSHREFSRALENEAIFSHLITMKLDGNAVQVIIKDLQRHPAKPRIMHADFQRVSKDRKIQVHIPLHYINQEKCHGVKIQGGMVQHNVNEVYIACLPQDLPEFIEVDMTPYAIGQSVHLSDLQLPPGVESVALLAGPDHDVAVATVLQPKVAVEETPEATPGAVPAAGETPKPAAS